MKDIIPKIGAASSGRSHSDDTKQKMSIASKANMTPEAREHLSKIFKGRKIHTEEFKARMRDLKAGVSRPAHVNEKLQASCSKWKLDNGFLPPIRCVECNVVIMRRVAHKFLIEGIGHIHNKCKKIYENKRSVG